MVDRIFLARLTHFTESFSSLDTKWQYLIIGLILFALIIAGIKGAFPNTKPGTGGKGLI